MPKVFVTGPSMDANLIKVMFSEHGWTTVGEYDNPDLVCFSGGEDVSPRLYNEEEHETTHSNEMRDAKEMQIFNMYEQHPKVGICRGGQFLNVMSGGEMWQNVNGHHKDHEMVDLIGNTIIQVTSDHHQMMIPHKDGQVLGISFETSKFEGAYPNQNREPPRDDTEVIWYRSTNSLCIQSHPEYYDASEELVNYFFSLIHYFWGLEGDTKEEAA